MKSWELKDKDLEFVVNTAAPQFADKGLLKKLIIEDEAFRKGLVGSEKVFNRVMTDEEIMVKISPQLFFEILLRRAHQELKKVHHTTEKIGTQQIPVFDAEKVVKLLNESIVLQYLANMLSSFLKIESFILAVRVRKGIWRKFRFNNMDIDALSSLCLTVDEELKFDFYKRIADVCLFISGIFPEYVFSSYFYPFTGEKRPELPGMRRRSPEEYEEEGRKFYRLAAEHDKAKAMELAESLWQLHENFILARKALNFVTQKYLYAKKNRMFGISNN